MQTLMLDRAMRLTLDEYQDAAKRTDRSGKTGRDALLFFSLGLMGEIGSLLSELKKKHRDSSSYFAFEATTREELGDTLWYFANLCSLQGLRLSKLKHAAERFRASQQERALFNSPAVGEAFDDLLLSLAETAARLTGICRAVSIERAEFAEAAEQFLNKLIAAADAGQVDFSGAAADNLRKIESRWPASRDYGDLYDDGLESFERLPRRMEVHFVEKPVGDRVYCYQLFNDVPLGDRLTDNSRDRDGYRYHDVFHLSYAAILGWSPTLRALLKLKRKTQPELDEREDGARAIITEEGISNWIFAQGLRHNAFATVESLEFQLLKTVKAMTQGYEVENRPYWMWEEAILEGFRVFRALRDNGGGTVTIDLNKRSIEYAPPTGG